MEHLVYEKVIDAGERNYKYVYEYSHSKLISNEYLGKGSNISFINRRVVLIQVSKCITKHRMFDKLVRQVAINGKKVSK